MSGRTSVPIVGSGCAVTSWLGDCVCCGVTSTAIHCPDAARTSTHAAMSAERHAPSVHTGSDGSLELKRAPTTTREGKPSSRAISDTATANCSSSPIAATKLSDASARGSCSRSSSAVNSWSMRASECPAVLGTNVSTPAACIHAESVSVSA